MQLHANQTTFNFEKSSWFHDFLQRRKSASHQKRIMRQLRRNRGQNNLQIVLKDGSEFKFTQYEVDGGLLVILHHQRGRLEFSFERIARATSASEY